MWSIEHTLRLTKQLLNKLLLSSKNHLFPNKAKCKNESHLHENKKNHFNVNDFALSLALKQRFEATRKQPNGHLEVTRETAPVLCRNALWDCFGGAVCSSYPRSFVIANCPMSNRGSWVRVGPQGLCLLGQYWTRCSKSQLQNLLRNIYRRSNGVSGNATSLSKLSTF